MTSRRRFALPAAAARLRGAAAVLGVAAFVAALIATASPSGQRLAALSQASSLRAVQADAGQAGAIRAGAVPSGTGRTPDVSGALALFGLGPRASGTSGQRVTRSHPRAPLHAWVRPNWGPLTSPFGMRWGRLHAGIDLAGPYGSTIVAATDGCISYAGPQEGYGEVMMISDWDGTETVYGHMSAFLRHSGCVKAGTPIAQVGSAGDATGPHLHFEVRIGGTPVDPIPFLAKRGVYV